MKILLIIICWSCDFRSGVSVKWLVGQVAVGQVAVSQVAVGQVAVGQVAVGQVAVGQVSATRLINLLKVGLNFNNKTFFN